MSGYIASQFKSCLNSVPVPNELMEGIQVLKILQNGKTKLYYLTLSSDRFVIYITPNKLKHGKDNGSTGKGSISKPLMKRVTSIGSNQDDDAENERSVDIGAIDRIQRDQHTFRFENARKLNRKVGSPERNKNELIMEKCFSIIYGQERAIDLMIADDHISREDIIKTMEALFAAYSTAKRIVSKDVLLLRTVWLECDKDNSDTINGAELHGLFHRINVYKKKQEVNDFYNSFAKAIGFDRKQRSKGLNFEQCVTLLHKLKRDEWKIKPVHQIWVDLFGEFLGAGKERNRVSSESFLQKFMFQSQGESQMDLETVEEIFRWLNQVEVANVATNLNFQMGDVRASKIIDKSRFEVYIMSEENDIYDPEKRRFRPEDMKRPLSEYWINSSHNTYLTGNQFSSTSSVEMYMHALYRGCRCLELDCFDGSYVAGKPVPIVYHGGTVTSKIFFQDIIEAIKAYLNIHPDCFPLILSLENHCSVPFQDEIAQLLRTIFGESLFIPDESKLNDPLPSPDELKGKVLIKGRRITDTRDDYYQGSTDYDSDSDDSEIEQEHIKDISDREPLSPRSSSGLSRQSSTSFSTELSHITIFHGVRFPSFEAGMEKSKDCMLSIDESKARKYSKHEDEQMKWIKYNQTHMSRVYPSAKRMDSSNFSPVTAWSAGCQMAALNIQTGDRWRLINDGRFRQNGNCGYILKPANLLSSTISTPDPVSLKVRVLSGSCLPKVKGDRNGEIINPYISVSVYDIPFNGGKELINYGYTHTVSKNGYNPIWAQEGYFNFKVINPDVAMLKFSLWDKDVTSSDRLIASSSIPITCVREGFRSVHLFDEHYKRNGVMECSSLLVEVKLRKSVQEVKMW